MDGSPHFRAKVCCFADAAEARLAMRGGAAAVGLVPGMPGGPGRVKPPHARVTVCRT